ncbi:hypothetical protein QTJ16_006408 [Diplocarpon rosae]|uniref:L-lysine 2,3-aminomutase n=1 Tax=Diplocarpon rosae TaxID=946125 RepID=A0AAD9STQ5_9HELO|nr:hypothetical protein QTJ16_006408 [Diplocarpon rosae]
MALFCLRTSFDVAAKSLSPQGYANTAAYLSPFNGSNVTSRYFKRSSVCRRGHAGLAHAEAREEPMYRNIGPLPPFPLLQTCCAQQTEHVDSGKTIGQTCVDEANNNVGQNIQISEVAAVPVYHRGSKFERVPYWQNISRWKDVPETQFLSYSWNTAKDVQGKMKLYEFLKEVLPEKTPMPEQGGRVQSREAFIMDVMDGIAMAPMSIRLTPHILARIDWENTLGDPLSRQFIPKKSTFQPDHPKLTLDSLHETDDSRLPPSQLLLARHLCPEASSHCPLYCRYCTRSYAVGADTETVTKAALKPKRARWNAMLEYIAATPSIHDVVISGGDSYALPGMHLRMIDPHDDWTDELIRLSNIGRERGVHVALHTHFNHPNEFSWVTREAAQRLHQEAVVVRNQSVLLRGVNDDAETMGALIRELADNNIIPYYVYAGDMVRGVEELRTPLHTILDLECQLRGSIAGFMTPQFVVDLPGGGGKRLATSYQTYDRKTGVSTFVAPAVVGKGKADRVYEYFDPLHSLPRGEVEAQCGV